MYHKSMKRTPASNHYLYNYRKFTELLVYVLSQLDEEVNETKLLKLLYFADANSYERLGRTISGNVTYYKNHFGPTPNANILMNLYKGLNNYLTRDEKKHDDYKSCRIKLNNRDFKFRTLSAEEIDIIDDTLARYGRLSVPEVVKLSHFDPPFLAGEKKKKIDFSYVRFRKSDEDYESHLDSQQREKIANDISVEGRRKLKQYAGAAT